MQTCVPIEKRSKREQRAAVRAHRAAWRGIKLCPRIMRKKTDYSFSDSTMNWYYYGYHNPNQISVAQDWQNAVSLSSFSEMVRRAVVAFMTSRFRAASSTSRQSAAVS